jgi:hypothetical protein
VGRADDGDVALFGSALEERGPYCVQARVDQFHDQLELFHNVSFGEFTIYDLRFLIALRDWTIDRLGILDLRFKIAFSYCSN